MHKHPQLPITDAVLGFRRFVGLRTDVAKHRKVCRAEVAEEADGAVVSEAEEVERRECALVPFATMRYCLQRLSAEEGEEDGQIGKDEEAMIR